MPQLYTDNIPVDSRWAHEQHITKVLNLATTFTYSLQGFQMELDPSKLMRCRGYQNRYFDFEKLEEVWICWIAYEFVFACMSFSFFSMIEKLIVWFSFFAFRINCRWGSQQNNCLLKWTYFHFMSFFFRLLACCIFFS